MDKKDQIQRMFNDISGRYDLLNHLLSFGIDYTWRRKFVSQLSRCQPKQVLDVATGTGDLAILVGSLASVKEVVGIDNASNMILIAKNKVLQSKFKKKITFRDGDAEAIPFPDESFDAVTVAFGVRNYEDLEKGLTEMRRVLRSGGVMMILEFSHPEVMPWKQLYGFYAKYMIPLIGRLVSRHKEAYTYLPESVSAFPSGENFTNILSKLGLKNVTRRSLTFGIATIYSAEK
jgi:demethylmenaquinone methyltransferase / 2-methoxy-6-polyprenyl-1,4-benzoquinol methylase